MLASTLVLLHTWVLLQVSGLTAIAESNRLSRLAAESMTKGRYAQAARDYTRMLDQLGVKDDAALANLGQAYLRQHDFANATRAYTRLTLSGDAAMRSLAHNQLGVIASHQKNNGEAAVQLKQALREDPDNQLARLNLVRLLKRDPKLEPPPQQQDKKKQQQREQQKQQQQDKQKQDQQKQQNQQQNPQQQQGQDRRPQDQQQGDKEQQKKEQEQADKDGQNQNKAQGQTQQGQEQNKRGSQGRGEVKDNDQGPGNEGKKPKEDVQGSIATREQLKRMQISEEGARQLLEAMRTSEVQYLQQRRHRRDPSSAKSGKPDW